MVLRKKQKAAQQAKAKAKHRNTSPIKRLKCEDCGQMSLVGMLSDFTSCTDVEFMNKPGASLWFLCLSCNMHTVIRDLTSDEMTNMAIAAKKDGRQFCEHCGHPIGEKNLGRSGHPFGDCPKCGGRL